MAQFDRQTTEILCVKFEEEEEIDREEDDAVKIPFPKEIIRVCDNSTGVISVAMENPSLGSQLPIPVAMGIPIPQEDGSQETITGDISEEEEKLEVDAPDEAGGETFFVVLSENPGLPPKGPLLSLPKLRLCGAIDKQTDEETSFPNNSTTPGHPCKACSQTFSSLGELLRHKWDHISEKSYACCYCEKKYPKDYIIEQKVHTGEVFRVCRACENALSQKISLVARRQIRSEKRFTCNLCSRIYLKECSLVKHLELEHNHVQINIKVQEED